MNYDAPIQLCLLVAHELMMRQGSVYPIKNHVPLLIEAESRLGEIELGHHVR
jgi:hypothetical protein